MTNQDGSKSRRVALVILALVVVAAVATAFLKPSESPPVPVAEQPPVPQLAPSSPAEVLVRAHSPVIGERSAPVTIVEVFDPSCEACRAWHPDVKKLLAANSGKVRLVLRYALFHKGSDVAAALLEMARIQGKFEPALDALFERQPEWAVHGAPDTALAARIVQGVGVDVGAQKQRDALPVVQQVLQQDTKDVNALLVERTPTFFVNGRQLMNASPQTLADAVAAEIARVGSAK